MIQSLLKAADVLEYMKIENKDYTIAEIAEKVKIPPSTTHRILNTLIICDFVTKDDRTHLYKLGPGLISLGMAASANTNLQNEASKELKNLSSRINEDSFLIIKSGNLGVVVAKADGPHSLKVVENFGREVPLHKGALRKVILAYQSDEFIKNYLNRDLEPYLEGEVNKELLLKNLKDIRKNQYSISMSEYINNTMGIGAPVFNNKNQIIASIGIIAPLYRVGDGKEKLIKEVINSANTISKRMGHF